MARRTELTDDSRFSLFSVLDSSRFQSFRLATHSGELGVGLTCKPMVKLRAPHSTTGCRWLHARQGCRAIPVVIWWYAWITTSGRHLTTTPDDQDETQRHRAARGSSRAARPPDARGLKIPEAIARCARRSHDVTANKINVAESDGRQWLGGLNVEGAPLVGFPSRRGHGQRAEEPGSPSVPITPCACSQPHGGDERAGPRSRRHHGA